MVGVVLAGKGSGHTQLHAGICPHPSALKMQSRSGVRPERSDDLVGEQTGEPE
jgi:hypothetical protein